MSHDNKLGDTGLETTSELLIPVSAKEGSNSSGSSSSSSEETRDVDEAHEMGKREGIRQLDIHQIVVIEPSESEDSRCSESDLLAQGEGTSVLVKSAKQIHHGDVLHDETVGDERMLIDSNTTSKKLDFEESMVLIGMPTESDENKVGCSYSSETLEVGWTHQHLAEELTVIRSHLENALTEKELFSDQCTKHKEENEILSRELSGFCSLLRIITNQHSSQAIDSDQTDNREVRTEDPSLPLRAMVTDCSQLLVHLKKTLDMHTQGEHALREAHCLLLTKEQDIEQLSMEVMELSVSNDIFTSLLVETQEELNAAQHGLIKSKDKELCLMEGLKRCQEANKELLEKINKANTDAINAETAKEESENKLASCRERLSIAVTKGRALVQKKDSLKQLLHQKTSELENCLLDLQHKTEALQSSEMKVQELMRCQDIVLSLKESLNEKNKAFMEVEEALTTLNEVEDIQLSSIVNKVKWLLNQKNIAENALVESRKAKEALSCFAFPDAIKSCNLDIQINWILKTLRENQDDSFRLFDKISKSEESLKQDLIEAHNDLDSMTALILEETIKSDLFQSTLEDLSRKHVRLTKKLIGLCGNLIHDNAVDSPLKQDCLLDQCLENIGETIGSLKDLKEKYDELAKKFSLISSKKDVSLNALLEELNIKVEDSFLDTSVLIEKCLQKIWERNTLLEDATRKYDILLGKSSQASLEKDELWRRLIEACGSFEGLTINELAIDNVSNKTENYLGKCIEKIREKISTSEELLTVAEQQFQRSQELLYIREYDLMLCEKLLEESCDKSEIDKLSAGLEKVSKEALSLKYEKGTLVNDNEKTMEKNLALREKLSLAVKKGKGLMHERDELNRLADQRNEEIQKLNKEIQHQDSLIAELKNEAKDFKHALEKISKLESDIIHVTAQRDQIQLSFFEKNAMLQQLYDSINNMMLPTSMELPEPSEKLKWLGRCIQESETALSNAEQKMDEKQKEVCSLTSRLEDAQGTITSLQDALSKVIKDVEILQKDSEILRDEKDDAGLAFFDAKQELEKAKTELLVKDGEVAEAHTAIKILQETLSNERKNGILLANAKNEAESQRTYEVALLNAKLAECMMELGEAHRRLQSQSDELLSQLNDISMLMNSEILVSSVSEGFQKKFEGIKSLHVLLQTIQNLLAERMEGYPGSKADSCLEMSYSFPQFENELGELIHSEKAVQNFDGNVCAYFSEIQRRLRMRNKIFCEKFGFLSSCMDEHLADVLLELQSAQGGIVCMVQTVDSLKHDLRNLTARSQDQESRIAMLEKEISTLVSACEGATQELHIMLGRWPNENLPLPEVMNASLIQSDINDSEERDPAKCVKSADKLLTVSRQVSYCFRKFENDKTNLLARCEELQTDLKQVKLDEANYMLKMKSHSSDVFELEDDYVAVPKSAWDPKISDACLGAKDDKLKKEAERITPYGTSELLDPAFAAKDTFLESRSPGAIFAEKINEIVFVVQGFGARCSETHSFSLLDKLSYITDKCTSMLQASEKLLSDKRELEENLQTQFDKIEYLNQEIERLRNSKQELEQKKNDLVSLTNGLEEIIRKFSGTVAPEARMVDAKVLLSILEKQVRDLVNEAESSKLREHELGVKLDEKQKAVNELLSKVTIQNPLYEMPATAEIPISVPTSESVPEISEIEDTGSLTTTAFLPSTHSRPLKKGSSEHLVLNIDSKHEKVKYHEADDDKGHMFISLNACGLIPKQGKLVADRLDGIWVSGGRVLMSRPRARLGIIAYCLLLHVWALVAVL